jgi:protein-glutamine gamma-glutamyltransferase
VTSPLGDIARRLGDPGAEVFRYRTDAPVDRWRLVVLDRFDGINWGSDAAYRRLGAELEPGPAVTVPTDLWSADVSVTGDVGGPWLPSQAWPASVTGTAPLVDEASGALRGDRGARYTLGWHSPAPTREQLAEAEVDPAATSGLGDLGGVPDDVLDLAAEAAGGHAPSFRTALRLERFLREDYARAVGTLPTGHSWPQLREFLLGSRRGTPEQFAAAYVVLARLNGIPARLAVGFEASGETAGDGSHVVRNGQVTAWPEVALRDIGWWPLDPAGAHTSRSAVGSPAALTDEVREELPPKDEPAQEPEEQPAPVDPRTPGTGWPAYLLPVVAAVAAVAVLGLLAVPVVRWARGRQRRRRTGAAGIAAAWSEARDRLRSHGVEVTAAMTVRDLIGPAEPVGGRPAAIGLRRLAHVVDHAIWSGADPDPRLHIESWAAVAELRRALRARSIRDRLRAAFDLRSLLPPR